MKKAMTASKERKGEASPSHVIDARIKELSDWRGETLARVRKLIKEADPDMVEEVKWRKPSNPAGRSGVGARRNDLHRRDLQGQSEADLRQGRRVGGPFTASSTPASKATPGAPSISMRATRSTKRR